jgi:hypothetical protein
LWERHLAAIIAAGGRSNEWFALEIVIRIRVIN